MTAAHLKRVKDYVALGIEEGAKLRVDGREFKMQGYENGFYMGGCLFDEVKPDMRIYKEEIFGPVLSVVRAKTYEESLQARQRPRVRQRRCHLHPRRRCGARLRRQGQRRHGRRQRADPGAACLLHLRRLEAIGLRRPQPARAGCDAILHQDQNRNVALALGREGRRGVRDPDHEIAALSVGADALAVPGQ